MGRVWVARASLDALCREADRRVPNETGGVLMGYSAASGDVVVCAHSGPGPRAVHRRTSYVPDYEYQEREIARVYRESGTRWSYLGDWHSHPAGPPVLSEKDCATLMRIAASETARAPRPLMALMAGGAPWTLSIWRGHLEPRRWLRRRLVVEPLEVQHHNGAIAARLT